MKTPEEIFEKQSIDNKFKSCLGTEDVKLVGNLKNGFYGGKVYKWLTQETAARKYVVIHGESEKFYNNIDYFASSEYAIQSLIEDIKRNSPEVVSVKNLKLEGNLK